MPARKASTGYMIGGVPKTAKNRRLSLASIGDDLVVTLIGLLPPVRRGGDKHMERGPVSPSP
jgi:hypothetical protein